MSTIDMICCINQFLSCYYDGFIYEFWDYNIIDALADSLGIKNIYEELFNFCYKEIEPTNVELSSAFHILQSVDRMEISNEEKIGMISAKISSLSNTISNLETILTLIEQLGIPVKLRFTDFKAIEYSSGYCFCAMKDGRIIADGGGYHRVVSGLYPQIKTCFSCACSLESVKQDNKKADVPVFAVRLDSTYGFYFKVCQLLREKGVPVIQTESAGSLKKTLKSLPKNSEYIIIGSQEECAGFVECRGITVTVGV